jgi:predicted Rossmann fold nucleotide-binding protein DprA/Smf involved in DNA uptake
MQAWQITRDGIALRGSGSQTLLSLPMTAFFASRKCPGTAIRAAMDWTLEQIKARRVVISGFHSPLEQSVLKVLIQAGSPAVVVLARPVDGAKLPTEWAEAISQGFLTIVSSETKSSRLTKDAAKKRNDDAAQLADDIVVAYASANGALAVQCALWLNNGRKLAYL